MSRKTKIFRMCVLCGLFTISGVSFSATNNSIAQINHKVSALKESLTQEQNKREHLQQKLALSETALGKLTIKLHNTQKNLSEQIPILQQLHQHQENYQQQLTTQQNLLQQQIRTAYVLGREPYLKMLLNQQDVNEVSRMWTYYHYLNQQRIQSIDNLQSTLQNIQVNRQQLLQQQKVLLTLQQKQQTVQQQLNSTTHYRQQLVQQINTNIETKKQKLEQLIANRNHLEKTIRDLEAKNRTSLNQKNFVTLRNKLSWPVKGRVIDYFGTQLDQSGLRLDGDVIAAPLGEPVHAIAAGRVVFAKWLAGYGLLLIISHDHGYMSLYGRNHSLYKKVGDIVQAGETISTVGNSGGFNQPTLYFAIRHNGEPINPGKWMKK